ncbi:MAG: response regulator [Pseudomonadaceae bacterium]
MKAIIVEDDPWIAELLRLLVIDLNPGIDIQQFTGSTDAQNQLLTTPADLVITDLHLSDGSGLDVLRAASRRWPNSLRILTTADISREVVLEARRAGAQDFIAKPFRADEARTRLARLLAKEQASASLSTSMGNLDGFLDACLQQPLRLAWRSPEQKQLAAEAGDQLGRDAFLKLAYAEPLVALHSLRRTNQQLAHGHETCNSLEEAWQRLGGAGCAALARNLARAGSVLEHPFLQQLAADFATEQDALSKTLERLSAYQSIASGPLSTAIGFSRLGEIAVISAIQHYLNYGQQVEPEQMQAHIRTRAAAFGNCIKTQQQLPFLLRELAGALFQLPQSGLRKDRILMRIAALETGFTPPAPEQLLQLRRLIGLPA